MTDPAPPVAEGEILAKKYRVEKVLGAGGMGVVVAATHVTLRQKVAIKFLLPDASKEVVTRFLREARSASRLKSEHVARVIDVGELDTGAPFLVMEYLDGSDLSHVLKARGALPIVEAVDYVLQACEGIAEAHTAGIVHRDLKPANLFLTKGSDGLPTVKVLDFGISKDTGGGDGPEDEHGLTRTQMMLGSPHYMAPEQMRSTRTVDARADIWSLGVILYQLLTKSVPYKAPSFMELAFKVMQEEAPPPMSRRAELPPGLDAAIMRCLKRERDERFANVAELAHAIAPFGGSDAARLAERIARMQGATELLPAPNSVGPRSFPTPTPTPAPIDTSDEQKTIATASGSKPISNPITLESAQQNTSSPRITIPPNSASAVTPDPSVQHGKTASAWSAAPPALTEARAKPSNSRFLVAGAAMGLTVGALVIGVLWSQKAHRAAAATAAREATPLESAAPIPSSAPAPTTKVTPTAVAEPPQPPATASAEPSASPVDAASASASTTPTAAPVAHAPAAATPSAKASAAPHAPSAAPVSAPAPTATAKKKNPLDIDIQ